jgi:hypothetical protein
MLPIKLKAFTRNGKAIKDWCKQTKLTPICCGLVFSQRDTFSLIILSDVNGRLYTASGQLSSE